MLRSRGCLHHRVTSLQRAALHRALSTSHHCYIRSMTRVVFMGTPEFAVPSLAALLAASYEVAGVLTRADQPAGRGQQVEMSPVKRLALQHDLTIQQPRTLRTAEAQAELAALAPDVIVVAAYGLILPQAVLDLPLRLRQCSRLVAPRLRGCAHRRAILAGDTEAGVSIMLMDGVDTAPCSARPACPSRRTTPPAR